MEQKNSTHYNGKCESINYPQGRVNLLEFVRYVQEKMKGCQFRSIGFSSIRVHLEEGSCIQLHLASKPYVPVKDDWSKKTKDVLSLDQKVTSKTDFRLETLLSLVRRTFPGILFGELSIHILIQEGSGIEFAVSKTLFL